MKTIKQDNREIKSKCCNAKVIVSGGGYDGEDIVPISETCSKCGKLCKIKLLRGRPKQLLF